MAQSIFMENLTIASKLSKINISKISCKNTIAIPKPKSISLYKNCKYHNIYMTTSEAIRQFSKYGKIGAINFANGINPGGGAGRHTGSGEKGRIRTQEVLALSPDAYQAIKDSSHHYPLFDDDRNNSLYFHNVTLMRNDDLTKCDRHYKYDMLVMPAIDMRSWYYKKQLENKSYEQLIDQYMRPMLINMMIKSLNNGCQIIILGHWGCGVFAPEDFAEKEIYIKLVYNMMHKTCDLFKNHFDHIVWAVLKI